MAFMYLKNIEYRENQTIREVMEGFSETAIYTENSGFGVIINDNGQCIGVVTDGMIRRVLVQGLSINVPIKDIMNKKPVLINKGYTYDEVMRKIDRRVRQIPVIDEDKHMVDLLLLSNFQIPWAKLYVNNEEHENVNEVIKSNWWAMGPKVEEFENEVLDYLGVKHAVAVNNGTAALDVALKSVGIKPGDEVIVPAFTYIATANAVLYQNAIPVFADIDPTTFTIDPDDVKRKITEKTRCIIAVDYAGHAANYDQLRKISEKYNLYLVEDGAPGIGGSYKGNKLCKLGDISITSFHIAKILTSVEGGMVFTDNDDFAYKARMIRSQGEDPDKKYYHRVLGHNYRMSDIHATIGLAQFKRIEKILEWRSQAAKLYNNLLLRGCSDIKRPNVQNECRHAWFLFPVLVPKRDEVKEYLQENGITTNVSWPMPIYDQPTYKKYSNAACWVTEKVTKEVLCLPMYYKILESEQSRVVDCLIRALDELVQK